MKTEMKLNIQLHVEGYAQDIFRDLNKPELKQQYESFVMDNAPLFDDEPDWRVGAIPIDSMPTLIKTIQALAHPDNLASRRRKLCLFISGENKEKNMGYSAWIGDDRPSSMTGGEIRIKEEQLTGIMRDAARKAHGILSAALSLQPNETDDSGLTRQTEQINDEK